MVALVIAITELHYRPFHASLLFLRNQESETGGRPLNMCTLLMSLVALISIYALSRCLSLLMASSVFSWSFGGYTMLSAVHSSSASIQWSTSFRFIMGERDVFMVYYQGGRVLSSIS
jgi:hypothetical protein